MNQKMFFYKKKKDDCNIFNHLFAIHIIIKSQGLISFVNLCVFVMMANTQLDDAKYSAGVFVEKVFGTNDHNILLEKLDYYGVRGIAN